MSKLDSEKLLDYIEEAKGWLDKAKDEYSKANPVRGGLILNLAQAEVKHAWELSNHLFVSKSKHKLTESRKPKYFIPVAAVLVLFIGLAAGVRFGVKSVNFPALAKLSPTKDLQSEVKINPNTRKLALAKQPKQTPEVVNQLQPTPKTDQSAAKKITSNQIAAVKPDIQPKAANSLPEHNDGGQVGAENVQNKASLKPVSQLTIDEEALTKEASHSLRNGK